MGLAGRALIDGRERRVADRIIAELVEREEGRKHVTGAEAT